MKVLLNLLALALSCAVVYGSSRSPPKVQLYSRNPGEYGKSNVVICHVSEFHPPDITIEIKKNGVELPDAVQTDLAFKPNWHFHLTRSVALTPETGDKISCEVTHGDKKSIFMWEPNM